MLGSIMRCHIGLQHPDMGGKCDGMSIASVWDAFADTDYFQDAVGHVCQLPAAVSC
jgi:hypothetical protein